MLKVFVLLMPTLLFAQTNLRELNYFPTKGTFFGETSFQKSTTTYDVLTADGEQNGSTLSQELAYAPLRGLALGFNIGHKTSELTVKGDDKDSYESVGLTNPTLYVAKRLQWQQAHGKFLDVAFFYTPNTPEAEHATTSEDGNVADGGQTFALSAALGKKEADYAWRLQAELTFVGEQVSKNADNGEEEIYDSQRQLLINYTYQIPMSENLALALSGGISFYSEQDFEDDEGDESSFESYRLIVLGGELKYSLSRDLMLRAMFQFNLPTDIDAESEGTDYELENFRLSAITFATTYQF
ncbi:MAG: hypothetical protein CME62_00865 [Halobacteriovoraceae bacterium]|nr:hypothetical protein [Halobacteriovoraceae bacterium]|tara:strand:- start:7044 stop:7937 length:894 start_codon:yes stop_codon:yes gene_type:complete